MQSFLKKIDQQNKNIWRYSNFYPYIEPENRFFIENSFSTLEKKEGVYFKREDQNILGSHKHRSLAFQISCAKEKGIKKTVISSTGNAAINAAYFCKKAGIDLKIFLSKKRIKSDINKFNFLQKHALDIEFVEKSLKETINFSKKNSALDLRPSTDDNAMIGFKSLGFELFEQIKDLNENDAVFMFITSGSSLLGVYESFKDLINIGVLNKMPQLHAVQALDCSSLAVNFDKREDLNSNDEIFTTGIKKTKRQESIIRAINESKGSAWLVNKEEFLLAKKTLIKMNVGKESICSLAGLFRCQKTNSFNIKRPIVVLSGKSF